MSFTWLAFSPAVALPLHSPISPSALSYFPPPLPTLLPPLLFSAQHIDFLCVLAWMVCAWSGCLGGLSSGMERKEKSREGEKKGKWEKRVIFNPFWVRAVVQRRVGWGILNGVRGLGLCQGCVCSVWRGRVRPAGRDCSLPVCLSGTDDIRLTTCFAWPSEQVESFGLEKLCRMSVAHTVTELEWQSCSSCGLLGEG